ncbi:MAG: FkbM family methyltransferase [Proteobacteria bacterium]|nr:FkbM family methyltransferase [Pseudomonadota bacterium]
MRFAGWQIKARFGLQAIVPWVAGTRLAVRRGMTGATGNLYFGLHEFMSMMLTLHFLREGDLFVDAGANVGVYTVLASGVCHADSLAIEPDPDTVADLRRNIEVNHLGERVRVEAVALGPQDGEVAFSIGLGAMNRVESRAATNVRMVAQRSLDGLTAGRVPAMIKLDVEGYEEAVFRGARRTMADAGLKVLVLEGATAAMLETLEQEGFERAYYDPFARRLSRTPNSLAFADGKWTLSNEFFVRDWPFVEERLATARPVPILDRAI